MKDHTTWACVSIGSCVASFVDHAMPYLQFIAVVVSIVAAVRSLLSSRKK